jgi:putative iron-regulated protein
MRNVTEIALAASLLGVLAACGDNAEGNKADNLEDAAPVVAQYVSIVRASYADSLETAEALEAAIDTFVATPNQVNFDAAKDAWKASREPYGQTEAYRFYEGPIDDADGPEGAINAWPLDEGFIDYVTGAGGETSGIINHTDEFPTLSEEVIAGENENGGEKNIATGYHAIEFLLWGQDLATDGPGARPYTDYVVGEGGTASNQDRRGQYLKIVAAKLVKDLQSVSDEWKDESGSYAAEFAALPATESIQKLLLSLASLSGAELAGERMTVAYDNKDQEDEHSCFGDYTLEDYNANAIGIQNVWLGRYGSDDGTGLDDLVEARDPALAAEVTAKMAAAVTAVAAIPAPLDQAILGADTDDGRVKILAAINALKAVAASLVDVADLLGLQVNIE